MLDIEHWLLICEFGDRRRFSRKLYRISGSAIWYPPPGWRIVEVSINVFTRLRLGPPASVIVTRISAVTRLMGVVNDPVSHDRPGERRGSELADTRGESFSERAP